MGHRPIDVTLAEGIPKLISLFLPEHLLDQKDVGSCVLHTVTGADTTGRSASMGEFVQDNHLGARPCRQCEHCCGAPCTAPCKHSVSRTGTDRDSIDSKQFDKPPLPDDCLNPLGDIPNRLQIVRTTIKVAERAFRVVETLTL
jgi:hypothetical protein